MIMKKINKKFIYTLLISISILFSTSCENKDIIAIKESIEETINTANKYVINTRTNKVHTYEHGTKIIGNKDNELILESSLSEILKDDQYDICHTYYAGIKKNIDLNTNDIKLIEKYMRLYDFIQNDAKTCEFLLSIFTVGSWYTENVYTYQGGANKAYKVELDAKAYASDSAYKRWENYREKYKSIYTYSDFKHILPVVYDSNKTTTSMVLYKCDLFKDKGNLY